MQTHYGRRALCIGCFNYTTACLWLSIPGGEGGGTRGPHGGRAVDWALVKGGQGETCGGHGGQGGTGAWRE